LRKSIVHKVVHAVWFNHLSAMSGTQYERFANVQMPKSLFEK